VVTMQSDPPDPLPDDGPTWPRDIDFSGLNQ
jgi:hypothetical protein